MNLKTLLWGGLLLHFSLAVAQQTDFNSFKPGQYPWIADDPENQGNGKHINAHGGGILLHGDTYYWFGEDKTANTALVGIMCYSSKDLYNWKKEGVALAVDEEGSGTDIEKGCIMERPKVIYNERTGKFVMYFHMELKGKGYDEARVGIASADRITGPYTFHRSLRPDAGKLPLSLNGDASRIPALFFFSYILDQYQGGHMSRDMTLFVDPDTKKAYHIYSSEGNYTLHIAELSDDYLSHTGRYERIAPGGNNEAPAIFKRNGRYYMITSGCTGWSPNPARQFTATDIMGPWTEYPNPCTGNDANTTFKSQSTYILPVPGKKNAYIYMGDRWKPNDPLTGSYVWLPIQFDNGLPKLEWLDEWDLRFFDRMNSYENLQNDIAAAENFLSAAIIGTNVYEYPEEAIPPFRSAIEEARKITSSMSQDEIADGIIALSNAAMTFRDARNPRVVNEIEPGDYYIKKDDKYLTNDPSLKDDASLKWQIRKITSSDAQIFTLVKDEKTGRYKIISKLDGRNVSEKGHIRNSWGPNDDIWRLANFRYNGSKYAIQFDGKGYGHWAVNDVTDKIEKKDYRELFHSDEQFIFTLIKATSGSAIEKTAGNRPEARIWAGHEQINIKTDTPVHISVFRPNGTLIKQDKINDTSSIGLLSGLYLVQVQSPGNCYTQKIVIN